MTEKALRPKDAATLIILRGTGSDTQVLMGKRHEGHVFLPNKFVFPGGKVDLADCRYRPALDLDPKVTRKLLVKMRGRPSPGRARGLAMAAVRETFEETGLIIGEPAARPAASRAGGWRDFVATGYAPSLHGLRFFARAVTPPGRPRRYDTRFFIVSEQHVCNLDNPYNTGSTELLDPYWFTLEQAAGLDLPNITLQILRRLADAVTSPQQMAVGAPVTYQRLIGKSWRNEII